MKMSMVARGEILSRQDAKSDAEPEHGGRGDADGGGQDRSPYVRAGGHATPVPEVGEEVFDPVARSVYLVYISGSKKKSTLRMASNEENMGKAAQADAAGILHTDPAVRQFQQHSAPGSGAGAFGIVALAIVLPFVAYYWNWVLVFGGSGGLGRDGTPEVGVIVANVWVDAAILFGLMAVGLPFLALQIGYFIPVGLVFFVPVAAVGYTDDAWFAFGVVAMIWLAFWWVGFPKICQFQARTQVIALLAVSALMGAMSVLNHYGVGALVAPIYMLGYILASGLLSFLWRHPNRASKRS